MKFYELIELLHRIIDDEKTNNKTQALRFIILAYKNILDKIYNEYSDNEAVTEKKINELELTKHMTAKLIDLSQTKITKKMAEEFKKNRRDNHLKQELSELIGIGTKKINELLENGLTNIKQIYRKKYLDMLNLDTQMVLMHKPLRHIKYIDVNKLEDALTHFSKYIVLSGSYRRKKPVIGDIDILFMPNKTKSVEKYLDYLKDIFREKIWIYANGPNKISMIFQPPSHFIPGSVKYKADIFIADSSNYYTMLLYTTGSKNFNIRMRAHARKMGLLLNQNGIFDINSKKKINKDSDSEKTLFNILDLKYVEPEKRF